MKYAICYNPKMPNSDAVQKELSLVLAENGLEFKIYDIDNLSYDVDFAFVIGGDGTILKAGRYFSDFDIPIFGINLGRLGFLSQALPEDLKKSIQQILSKNYRVEKRLMLKSNGYKALNDFVIKGDVSGRASRFALEINDKFVCEYFADGVIISTPTGSTAYGMAAGGPILAPDTDVITVVPICPHTFAARPIVVSSNSVIKFIPKNGYKYTVYADGQVAFSLENELIVKSSEKMASLALLSDDDFYSVLRSKLHWGFSPIDS